jgi:hypothetical protein
MIRILALTVLLALGAPAGAAAEWHLTPFAGLSFKGDTTIIDLDPAPGVSVESRHWTIGGTATLIGAGPLGVEGLFMLAPSFFQSGNEDSTLGNVGSTVVSSRLTVLMGNVVLATPLRWNEYGLRPFVSGGLGLMRAAQRTGENEFTIAVNALGVNIGGGAVGFLSERVGLRFDLRYFRMQPKDVASDVAIGGRARLDFWNGSVGLVIRP